jgi:hypothetical protein
MFDAGAIVGRLKLDKTDFDAGMKQATSSLGNLAAKVSSASLNIRQVGRELSVAGRNLMFFGAGVVTPMMLAFKSAEKYSTPVRQEMERLNNVFIQMRVSIAESLVPVMHSFTNVLADLRQRWDNLSPAMRQSFLQTTFLIGSWTILGGLAGSLAGKFLSIIGNLGLLSKKFLEFASLHPQFLLTAAALTAVGIVIVKLGGLKNSLNWLETSGLTIARNWIITGLAITTAVSAIALVTGKLKDLEKIQAALFMTLDTTNEKLTNLGQGKSGALANFADDVKAQLEAISGLFTNLGKTEFKIPDWIPEASKSFAEGWHDAIEKASSSLHDWGAMATSIVEQTTQTMQGLFSNLFQNVLKGQLNSAKDFFVEWGNFVLKIISDVIAQMITAKIIGTMFGFGTSAVAGIGGYGAGTPSGTTDMGSWSKLPGYATGIENVPETGIYKLHKGEQVVPAYDAAANRAQPITIYNLITPEAVAAAMSGKEGHGVIINVVNLNSLRNGIMRREVKNR